MENFFEVKQDTLVLPQQQHQSSPIINVRKPQIDFERAEEIIRQFEQREQEVIATQQPPVASPKSETLVIAPSIEVDTLPLQDTIPVISTVTLPERIWISGETRQVVYPSSITLFIICGLALLAVIKYYFGKNMLEAIQSFFNYRQTMRMFEERRETDRQVVFLSNVLFILTTGIFISITLPFFGVSLLWESYAISILIFSAATGLLYILKACIWHGLGNVFMVQEFSKIYIYNMFLYNHNIGWMIFPLVAIIPYVPYKVAPYLIYSVIVTVVLSYFLKLFRFFQIIHGLNVSVFYFILYLCTLEILPLFLFVKCCKILWEFNLFI